MMRHTPLDQVKAAERYINSQVKMGLSTKEAACELQTQHVSDLIRQSIDISQNDCSDLFEYLKDENGTFSRFSL